MSPSSLILTIAVASTATLSAPDLHPALATPPPHRAGHVREMGGAPRPEWATASVPDTVWRLVVAATDTHDDESAKAWLRDAESHARASVVDDPADVGRRYAYAVVLGLRANFEGGQTKVRAAAALHEQLGHILGASQDHVGARHMLGRLHAGVRRMNGVTRWIATNLLGGGELKKATWEAAEENLAFAEARAPGVADHHLQLALLYRDTGRPALALRELEHALAIPAVTVLEESVLAEARMVRDELAP